MSTTTTETPKARRFRLPKPGHSVADLAPSIVSSWSAKNDRSPEQVARWGDYPAIFECPLGHEWTLRIKHRRDHSSCPYCTNQRVLAGFNDVATTHPDVVQFWGDDNTIRPTEVVAGSGAKITTRDGREVRVFALVDQVTNS